MSLYYLKLYKNRQSSTVLIKRVSGSARAEGLVEIINELGFVRKEFGFALNTEFSFSYSLVIIYEACA